MVLCQFLAPEILSISATFNQRTWLASRMQPWCCSCAAHQFREEFCQQQMTWGPRTNWLPLREQLSSLRTRIILP